MKKKFICSDCGLDEYDLHQSIKQLLSKNMLMSLSTSVNDKCNINTAYYAYSENYEMYFLSEDDTEHCKNIIVNPSVAAAIWNDSGIYGENLQGLQLFGLCKKANGIKLLEGLRIYNNRFPAFSELVKHPEDFAKGVVKSRLYTIDVLKIKLIDEAAFGRRKYIVIGLD